MIFRYDIFFAQFLLLWRIVSCQQEIESNDYLVESNQEWTEEAHSKKIISHFSKKEETSHESNTNKGFEYNFNLTTLKYVAIITRHGSRSPINTYPNDPYPFNNSTYWPDGPHQLTRYGKQQLYKSGQNIRKRYNGFISKMYIPHEISVKSNVVDRDFMSAACLLAGLFPPSGYQLWHPKIYWQPVPIWEDPADVAALSSSNCPRFAFERENALAELDRESSQYQKLLQYVSSHVGEKVDKLSKLGLITDTLIMQEENGFKLPVWSKQVYPKPLLTIWPVSLAATVSGSAEMIRLAAGPILKMLNNQILEKVANKTIPGRLMFIEAAHDVTLQVLLRSFGYEQPFPIKTSAYLIFELHQNSVGQFVQVLYYNSSATVTPNILNLPECPSPCSLNKFTLFVEKIAPQNWGQECELTKQKKDELIKEVKSMLLH